MLARAALRRKTSFVFSFGAFGVFCLVTGLIGFKPRGHFTPFATSRLIPGVWTGAIIWEQVAAGCVCVAAAAFAMYRINRALGSRGGKWLRDQLH